MACRLARIADKKLFQSGMMEPLRWVKALAARGLVPPSGLTTQFVVGAADEADREILDTTNRLYREVDLRRAYFSAFKFTTLAVAITLLYTFPAFVALLSAVFLGERLTQTKIGAVALTLLGSGLVAQVHQAEWFRLNLQGILFGLLAGITAASYSIFGKRALGRYAPWTVVLYAFAAGGLFLAVMSGPRLLRAVEYPSTGWLWILGLALVPSLGGYTLYTLGLRDLPASRASIVATWEVVTTALLGWLVFREHLTPVQLLGIALVCIGIAWIQRSENRR